MHPGEFLRVNGMSMNLGPILAVFQQVPRFIWPCPWFHRFYLEIIWCKIYFNSSKTKSLNKKRHSTRVLTICEATAKPTHPTQQSFTAKNKLQSQRGPSIEEYCLKFVQSPKVHLAFESRNLVLTFGIAFCKSKCKPMLPLFCCAHNGRNLLFFVGRLLFTFYLFTNMVSKTVPQWGEVLLWFLWSMSLHQIQTIYYYVHIICRCLRTFTASGSTWVIQLSRM